MSYEILAFVNSTGGRVSCAKDASGVPTIIVTKATDAWVVWVGGTNYDMNAGDAAHDFSFRGSDPHASLITLLRAASSQEYTSLLAAHEHDYKSVLNKFALDLGQRPDLNTPTDVLKANYKTDIGNPYLEWVMFNYGRYLFASSARGNLPANLQGKWAFDMSAPWSGGTHSTSN
jgi:alpha-L-fucosidase 2